MPKKKNTKSEKVIKKETNKEELKSAILRKKDLVRKRQSAGSPGSIGYWKLTAEIEKVRKIIAKLRG